MADKDDNKTKNKWGKRVRLGLLGAGLAASSHNAIHQDQAMTDPGAPEPIKEMPDAVQEAEKQRREQKKAAELGKQQHAQSIRQTKQEPPKKEAQRDSQKASQLEKWKAERERDRER
jgi:hypothetical protein